MRVIKRHVGVSLRRLLPEAVTLYAEDIRATACTSDARRVRPGDVYVALDASECDGHDHVQYAIDQGAMAVVVERALPQAKVPMCLVPDTRKAFALLCQALSGNPSQSLWCAGVTGTDGKTVTSRLVSAVLRAAQFEVGALDDLSGSSSVARSARRRFSTAPEIARGLAELTGIGATHAVLEVGSEALSQHACCGVGFDAICFTNLSRAHLRLHNSVASYHQVKARLCRHLRPGGVTILNGDDQACVRLASVVDGPVLTFGLEGHADVTAEFLDRHPHEESFLLCYGNQTVAVRTRLIGVHHVQNCLAAAAVGLAAGVDLVTIASGIERIVNLPARQERCDRGAGPRVYLDASSTPTGLSAALDVVRVGSLGRIWCVAASLAASDEGELAEVARIATSKADFLLLECGSDTNCLPGSRFASNPGGGPGQSRVLLACDRLDAIETAVRSANADDVVLVSGSVGHAQWERSTIRRALDDRARNDHLRPVVM